MADADKLIQWLNDGDVVVIPKKEFILFQKCCDCGLWHRIEIDQGDEDLRLKFVRLDGKPDADEYNFEKIRLERAAQPSIEDKRTPAGPQKLVSSSGKIRM